MLGAASGARVSSVVSAFESLGSNMGIDLGGGETGMAQKRLNASKVGSIVEEVGSKGMSEFVRTER